MDIPFQRRAHLDHLPSFQALKFFALAPVSYPGLALARLMLAIDRVGFSMALNFWLPGFEALALPFLHEA